MIGNRAWLAVGAVFLSVGINNDAKALEYQWQPHHLEIAGRARLAKVNAVEDARAASIMGRIRLSSEWHRQFKTLFEVEHVELAWEDEFTNGVNFNNKPVIPDVEGTDLNQALATYSPTNTVSLILGRESLNLGNQRFVGSNRFWQNEQSLDIAGFEFDFGSASELLYRYVDNANRINGEDAGKRLSPNDPIYSSNNGLRPAKFLGDHDHDSHLVYARFKEWDFAEIHAYYFDMDIEDAKGLSNETIGVRYEYKNRLGKLRLLGHAEIALQERTEMNSEADLQYQTLGAGVGYRSSELTFHYERLGEDKGVALVTPLASLHDENGWADKFLMTPNSGLQDHHVKYIWRKNPFKLDLRYHFFSADDDHRTLAQELDIDLQYHIAKGHTLLLRIADFETADPLYQDEERFFLMYSYGMR